MLKKSRSNNKSNYDGQNNSEFENNEYEIKPIEFGNELDEIEIKPLTPLAIDAKSNSPIASDDSNTTDNKFALMFDLTNTHKYQVFHGSLSILMQEDIKNNKYIHNNHNLVKFKKGTNQNKKNIYELAIKYLQSMSASHDRSEQQACIEVFPNVYVNLNNYTKYKISDDGKVYLTNKFTNRNIEVIIDDNSITINKKTPYEIIQITYSRTINENDVYSSFDQILYNIYDKKNFKHLKFQLKKDLEIIKETEKRQSYINNLTRTAKYKKIKTPLALCGFDMFDQNRCCLCGKGCYDLDDVEKNNKTFDIIM